MAVDATAVRQFQRFLSDKFALGARAIAGIGDPPRADTGPGSVMHLAEQAEVLAAYDGPDGRYYSVHLGSPSVSATDDYDPSDGWTVLVADPLVKVGPDTWAIEQLNDAGHRFPERRWVLLTPTFTEQEQDQIERNL